MFFVIHGVLLESKFLMLKSKQKNARRYLTPMFGFAEVTAVSILIKQTISKNRAILET